MDTLIFPLLLQVILIALNAIFACAEIAVISLNETKVQILAEEGNRKAKKLKVFKLPSPCPASWAAPMLQTTLPAF